MKQLITGRDGRVRAPTLAVPSGDGQTSTFQRPIQLPYPLKTNTGNQVPEMGPTIAQPTQLTQDPPKEIQDLAEGTRATPKRAAALKEQLSELDY